MSRSGEDDDYRQCFICASTVLHNPPRRFHQHHCVMCGKGTFGVGDTVHAACGNCSSTSVIYNTRWGGIFDSSVAAKLTDTEITERCMKLFKNQVFMNNIPFQRFRHVPLEMVVKELIDLEWSPDHPKELRDGKYNVSPNDYYHFLERVYTHATSDHRSKKRHYDD